MNDAFRRAVEQRLEVLGLSAIQAATRAGLPREAIRSVLQGASPGIERAFEICKALGIELQIGAMHSPAPVSVRELERFARYLNALVLASGGDPYPDPSGDKRDVRRGRDSD